jgi:hypothetical protein
VPNCFDKPHTVTASHETINDIPLPTTTTTTTSTHTHTHTHTDTHTHTHARTHLVQTKIDQPHNMRVVKSLEQLDLLHEVVARASLQVLRRHKLESDVVGRGYTTTDWQRCRAGLVDLAKAAASEVPNHTVPEVGRVCDCRVPLM